MPVTDFVSGLFGPGPEKEDTSAYDADNRKIIADLKGKVPQEYYSPDYKGDFVPTQVAAAPQVSASEMSKISTDPRERDAQFAALNSLGDQAKTGFSAQDKADLAGIEDSSNRANKGRQDAIAQNFAARGMSGSGMELAQADMAAQGAANQQYQGGLQKAAMSQNNQRAAVAALGQLGGQMQGQDFSQQAQKASAADAIAKFNTTNTIGSNQYNAGVQNTAGMRNADARQGVATAATNGHNNFNQNQFQNNTAVAQVGYNANANAINGSRQDYQNEVNGKAAKQSAIIGAAATVGGAAMMASDENLKKNVKTLSPSDIEDFLNSIQPKSFKYKDQSMGEGNRVGILAQDLERSKVGKNLVKEGPDGKEIDINNAIGALFDAVAHVNRKVRG
ncbi:MAG: tail fiber domain-containing protein [Ktedonobacteraceae bacterium]|nr:tail fiber domain-containing protein [Ktedonobacteraceae bacterium]